MWVQQCCGGGEQDAMVSFILKSHEVAQGGALAGWGVLHKLSSRSACIAWPTVQRDKRNVGQTPPSSFFLSLCLYPSLSTHTNITALWTFQKTEKNVLLVISLCFFLQNQPATTNKNSSMLYPNISFLYGQNMIKPLKKLLKNQCLTG